MTLTAGRSVASRHGRPRRLLAALDRPADAVQHLGPNWFAAVMGTGIVANAAVTLPVQITGQREFALLVWLVAVLLLTVLLAATATHWARYPAQARAHVSHPVMSHFYGAPPMAMLTVGAGALLVGKDLIGLRAAVDLSWVLWTAGTFSGLLTAAMVPYFAFTRHDNKPESAFGGWLMPVVPPMVSASSGALLVPYAAPGQVRETLVLGCYAMFGLSLFASIVVIALIWGRLAQHKVGMPAAVPTLWIVLGPLGQSATAAGVMGYAAAPVLPAPYADGAATFALFYSLVTWGFAMLWLAIATAITLKTLREHLPFSLAWWSFTFPVGTVVTGTSGLASRTHLDVFIVAAAAMYLFLLSAWVIVLARTTRGVANGRLLLPPPAPVIAPGAA